MHEAQKPPVKLAADYFDRMRAQEHHLRHTLPALTALDLCRLPYTVQHLARLVGLPESLALVDALGGITVRIPHGDTPAGRAMLEKLAAHVGENGAQILSKEYGGSELYIPNCKQALVTARDAALLKDRDALAAEGMSERSIAACLALRYRISDRYVWKILKKPAPAAPSTPCQQASLI